jgi:hypothetical protein
VLAFRIAYVSLLMVAVTFAAFEWELARGSSLDDSAAAALRAPDAAAADRGIARGFLLVLVLITAAIGVASMPAAG